ncbi:TRAP transporter permease [Capillibacterium thermochitinicola]|uniref:TRAP transporter permease n=1 Tax=Capillibacterium thermochitinicola TaxID=2699427 RepID=A0A8J6HZ53_9FIRM|nr:TRAP transporter permease [Capillibacterium thermochitinicola]MBA2132730.1 TRAP transporter permease [Capillibacterium thermochitinicola]
MSERKNAPQNLSDLVDPVDQVDVDAVMAEYDRESNTRRFSGVPRVLVRYMLAAFSLYVFYMNLISVWPEQIRRASFVGLIVFMAFMLYPAKKRSAKRENYIPLYDLILGVIGAVCYFYYVVNFSDLAVKATRITPFDTLVGAVGVLITAEVCRRVVGLPILVVASTFVGYAFFAGYSLRRIVYTLFYTLDGVIGTPIGVCSTFIVLFIILASFLEKTNIGSFFIDIANSVAGWATGGPAKVAVISSALEGMYSGSSVANTVGSGSVTIPVMKKTGYDKDFAAAVEAAASTGGQIMPPIMGAAAFLMAEMTGVPYSKIAVAGIFPAILYFAGIFLMVHFEAKKTGLKGLPREAIPGFFRLFLTKGYLFLPIVVLVVMMSIGYTPSRAACLAILAAVIVSSFRRETRMTPKTFITALENGAKNTVAVAAACSIAGIIVGVVSLTGIGLKLAEGLLFLSGGIDIIALFLTMIACLILGMGVPTTANYVIMATITAPIILKLIPETPVLAAHFFVFYFGVVADITPPVALAAYAGAAISGGNPLRTGVIATRLAIAAFIVPYMVVLNPAMLLINASLYQIVQFTITSLAGMFALAGGLEGFMRDKLSTWQRILAVGGGLLLIHPDLLTDLIGLAMIGVVVAFQYGIKTGRDKLVAA